MNNQNSFEPKLVVFCCENSGLLAAEQAGKMQLCYPDRVDLIKLPCAGKIDVIYFLKALEKGADGAILLACHQENCRFLKGNSRAGQRVVQVKKMLKEIGIEEERVGIYYIAGNMGHEFVEIVRGMYDRLREMGPNPGKVIK
ncbi:methyl-viologen-reducing hydrogenase delta subunit [Thermincola ferriacetica]|uniref:Methyl-viologen-reducing hydrogenase delta subunit n=1 Tax=Thermincola ferriacetica TaxID=281456 RepID=A0A0L6W6A0_9FIRM|nr:hydrogenase iron-sulfur subunit [Thermincola ferriacetica]KNZ71045.1 methyl-viologen-reducing hydrogenase delta subunit [Thermincola ferriacetica]